MVMSARNARDPETGTFCLARQQRMTLTDLGEHAVEPCAPALASLGRILFVQETLASDRHRLRDGRVERLGEPSGRFLRARVGDRDHADAYIWPP